MTSPRFLRVVSLLIIVAVMVLSSAFAVCAESATEFSLSHTQVKNNRLFEVVLSCKADCNLSAFVAEITYDSEVISFDSGSVVHSGSQYSVNSSEKGKLTAVYLNEEGVSCKENTEIMIFKFKALCAGNTEINLSVRDAITSDSENIEVLTCTPSQVVISQSAVRISGEISDAGSTDEEKSGINGENESALIKGTTNIGGVTFSNQTIVSVVLSFLCIFCLAVYIAYRIGIYRQKIKQKPAPLVYKEKAGNSGIKD